MKSDTNREIAERVIAKHLGPREGNPLMQQIGRIYERLVDDFEASLNAERERCAKIAEDGDYQCEQGNCHASIAAERDLAEKVFKFILPNRPLATVTELAKPVLDEVDALHQRLAQVEKERETWLETLTSCDSVLSYIYHRERSRLLAATQDQLFETMCKVERITRKRP